MGELFIRVLLSSELNRSRAAKSAAGWGNDTRVAYSQNNRTNYLWATKWDTKADADEFRYAIHDYFSQRGTTTASGYQLGDRRIRIYRPSDRTVVICLGSDYFVSQADVSSHNGTVTVGSA